MNFFRLFFCLIFLSACGNLQPLHAQRSGWRLSADAWTRKALENVRISPVPEKLGVELRRQIQQKIAPEGPSLEPLYYLDITLLKPEKIEQGIQSDNTVTRVSLTYTATYILRLKDPEHFETFAPFVSTELNPSFQTEEQTLTILLSDKAYATGTYNIVGPYATVYSEEKTKENLMKILAENIANHLISFFRSVSAKGVKK